jgi:hypothetical protein
MQETYGCTAHPSHSSRDRQSQNRHRNFLCIRVATGVAIGVATGVSARVAAHVTTPNRVGATGGAAHVGRHSYRPEIKSM